MMYGPAYHRRQAAILTRISKAISNVDAAAALRELAAKHRELADEASAPLNSESQSFPRKTGRLRSTDRDQGDSSIAPRRPS
jgi:hypothetical protein